MPRHVARLSFGSPLALLSLLAIPAALVFLRIPVRRPGRQAVVFTNLTVLAEVSAARSPRRRLVPAALVLLALACAAVATAKPTARLPARVDNATIVLLVDVSGSMSARDVEPTRLDAAVAAMRGFVQRLPEGMQVGLVQFSDSAQVLARPTADHVQVTQTLGLLDSQSGTAIGAGILTAVGLARSSLARDGVVRQRGESLPVAIVLLSDGKQTSPGVQPLDAAARARASGIRIDTVALGTTHGILGYGPYAPKVAPDPPLMRAIAKATGGQTSTARNQAELASFYRSVRSSFGRADRPRDIAAWFLAAAAVMLVAGVALGRVWGGLLG
jgi:Ca-activated chloride channel homolog